MFSITSDLDALTIRRFYERCELLRILANRLPFGRLRHCDPDAIHKCNRLRESFRAGHMNAVIRVYDAAGNVIETHERRGESKVG